MIITAIAAVLGAGIGNAWAGEQDGAEYVGEDVCRGCHDVEARQWDQTLHAKIFHQGPRSALQRRGCEACHGPGSAHAQEPARRDAVVSFTRDGGTSVERQNEMCMECHAGGSRLHWSGSLHEQQQLACSDCHNLMTLTSAGALQRESSVSQTCLTCHPEQRIEFNKRSHMPLFEGKIGCSDCHEPHGSITDPLIRGDDVNQLCYGCHAEKRGPFLWEHAPVRDNCLSCHSSHGSNHNDLLQAKIPFLCQECHAQTGVFEHVNALMSRTNLSFDARDERLTNRGCLNCHVQIHGSNHPSGARFHR